MTVFGDVLPVVGCNDYVMLNTPTLCRAAKLSSTNRYVFVLASQHDMVQESSTAKVAAALAAGLPTPVTLAIRRGDPAMIFIDPACRTQAILDLAQQFAEAQTLQAALAVDDDAAAQAASRALHDCVSVAGSAADIDRWQQKCREAFGTGFQVSLAELAEMAACEARLHASGRPSALSPELAELFSAAM